MEESLQYAYFRPYGKNYKLNSSAVPCLLESLKLKSRQCDHAGLPEGFKGSVPSGSTGAGGTVRNTSPVKAPGKTPSEMN
jgi:hypothetical protein